MHYDRLTRLLHMCLAFGIVLQLIASTMMELPRPGQVANTWWGIHEYLGVVLAAVLVVHWVWTLSRTVARGEAYLLFPWFSKAKLGALAGDMRETLADLKRGRLPEVGDKPRPLPAALQSLGLLLATFLAFSGTIIMLVVEGLVPRGDWFFIVREAHGALGGLMWLYLIAHPLIAVAHEIAGQPLIRTMFTVAPNEADR